MTKQLFLEKKTQQCQHRPGKIKQYPVLHSIAMHIALGVYELVSCDTLNNTISSEAQESKVAKVTNRMHDHKPQVDKPRIQNGNFPRSPYYICTYISISTANYELL